MRWRGQRESDNVEDRRGISPGGIAVGGGIGTILLVLVVMALGGDPSALLNQTQTQTQPGQTSDKPYVSQNPQEEERKHFVATVLASTEDVWRSQFKAMGKTYREPTLVLFSGQVNSACGMAGAAMGPFYCPGDSKLYIDLSFYDELKDRFGAPGDFAQAYVVAHEVGHHVQNLLGISEQVNQLRSRLSEKEFNKMSVRMELQADFFAGVWAHHAQRMKNLLDERDIEDGLRAASAIGDDTLQRQSQGHVVPDAFTHGTSAQRVRWFRKGWDTGDINQGDTFNASQL